VSQDGQGRRARSIAINVQHLAAGDTVVHLIGDLVDDAAAAMQQTLIDQLSRAPTRLIVNLSAVSWIDNSGVEAFTSAAAVAGEAIQNSG
jgi:anti-anti-sigma regulatory factor